MRRIFLSLLCLSCLPAVVWAETGIPAETLQMLKGATVFVKVEGTRWGKSGSGFLMKVDGKTGYVVTNHHVVAPPQGAAAEFTVTLVFWSGTTKEKAVQAEVVASDKSRDLAVLKVSHFKDLPEPIDLTKKPKLSETMTVYIIGFPLGEVLATNKGFPEITFGKGSVSSIRHDDADDVAVVQIDGELNPGNSGGPVVDTNGELVGVAAAKIKGTTIGLAIPTEALTRMLLGRVGALGVRTVKVDNASIDVQIEAGLLDPMNKIKGVAVYHVRADALKEAPKRGKDGWAKLPGAQKVELTIDKQRRAAGVARLPAVAAHFLQAAYVDGDGNTVFTGPAGYQVELDKAVISVVSLPDGKPAETSKEKIEASNPAKPAGGEGNASRMAGELVQADATKQAGMLESLRESKGPEHTQALLEAIPKLEGEVKKKARDALADRMSRMTGATLRERLRDDNAEMRRASALAVAMKEDKTHIPRLIELLDDAEMPVSRAAYAALKSLSGKDFGPPKDASPAERATAVAAWKAWWKENGGK
jgi:S1-C subfamily serine protease